MKASSLLAFALSLLLLTACGGSNNNNTPADSDGDGVQDSLDAFPNDANETADTDSDGVGDNADNCAEDANEDQQDSDGDGAGDACEATYSFVDAGDNDTVSYTGQTARHILILDLVTSMQGLARGDERTKAEILDQALNRYYRNRDEATDTDNFLDNQNIAYTLKNDDQGILITNTNDMTDLTLGSISTGKNLNGKIAGNDKCHHILVDGDASAECEDGTRGEFFGWEAGVNADPLVRTPDELVQYFFDQIAEEASSDDASTVATEENDATTISLPTVNSHGQDFRQLAQKFLLGAVTFSQGTADYLQIDFGSEANLTLAEGKAYTEGQHDWDEAFGYYGVARNAAHYTDLEARAKSGRDGFLNGYNDANADGSINIRSEVMLGNSQNCAKRDAGATVATTLTEDAFDAFLAGRQILQEAGDAGELTDAQRETLNGHIVTASQTWEKCIAATVIHYINDVLADMDRYTDNNKFENLEHFMDLAKHWGEMKGFALGLQFSPNSPFRTEGSGVTVADLKEVLALFGDAPVLPDGTQMGAAFDTGVEGYKTDLTTARTTLMQAYGFNEENVNNW